MVIQAINRRVQAQGQHQGQDLIGYLMVYIMNVQISSVSVVLVC